jgi:predicted  nucleic acid-binding Zn-ribbon protein
MRPTERRAPTVTVVSIGVLLLVAPACHREPEVTASAPAPISSLGQLSHELDRLQGEVQGKNKEIASLVRQYQDQGGRLPDNFGPELTPEQKELLAKRVQEEKMGMRALLQDILDREAQIKDLKDRINAIESGLPSSFVAQKGDKHEDILRTFLKDRGIGDIEAKSLIAQVHLYPQPLEQGHRVWAYYRDGVLGTWVAKGDGNTSPAELEQRAWRALTDQRDTARRQLVSLRRDLEVVTHERGELRQQLDVLRNDVGESNQQMEQLRQEARAGRQGARYVAGSKQQLREHGVIGGGGLFGGRTSVRRLEHLETLDLDQTNEILLRSSEHGLSRIQKVKVLPDGFRRDQDYAVHLMRGGTMARVSLLDVDKFKRSTFVVVLE